MSVPIGLKLKAHLVIILCGVARPFLKDPLRIEALESLGRNYELLLKGEA
jgi:hypothetical protein